MTRPAERPYFLEGIEYLEILDGDGHYLRLPKLTTAQRDALSATEGMMIYNTDTGRVAVYQDGGWVEIQPWVITGTTLNFFLSDDAADVGSYYYMYPTESGNGYSELTSPSLSTGDDQLLWSFVTEAGEPGVEVLALGAYTTTLFLKKTGNKDVRVYWKLFKRDTGGTETEILQSAVSDYLTADNSQYLISAYLNEDQTLDPTDRLVLKLYANVSGTGTDVTVTLTMEGDYDSRLTINVLSSAFNLDRLSDVTITSPADNELLAYDSGSGKWINQTPSEAGVLAADGSVPLSGDLNADSHSIANLVSITGKPSGYTPYKASGYQGILHGNIFNVRDFGAKGDGTTDDTAAIQAAIDAAEANGGGIVYFPATANWYLISSTLTLTAGGIRLMGGASSTYAMSLGSRIGLASGSFSGTEAMLQINIPNNDPGGVTIEHLFFRGYYNNQSTTSARIIDVTSGKDITIWRCRFYQAPGYAIYVRTGAVNILYNWIHKTKNTAIYLDVDGHDAMIIGNQITARDDTPTYYTGIVANGDNVIILGNIIFQCRRGIYADNKVLIACNRINHCQSFGIRAGDQCTVVGNFGYSNGLDDTQAAENRAGIRLAGNDVVVVGNHFWDADPATQSAVVALNSGVTNCRVSGNHGSGNTIGIYYFQGAPGDGTTIEGVGEEDTGGADTPPSGNWEIGDIVKNTNAGASGEVWLLTRGDEWVRLA